MTTADEDVDQARPSLSHGLLADAEERAVIFAVLDSFRRRQNFYALNALHKSILSSEPLCLLDRLTAVDDAIDRNADIADAILQIALLTFGLPENPPPNSDLNWHNTAKPSDMAKAHSTIRQFYRDWSSEGFATETEPLLRLILTDLTSCIDAPSLQSAPKILLPGAGLGRLLFELSLAGYEAEGNEISWHQLLASNFILNVVPQAQVYTLHPFVTTFTNHINRISQLTAVKIPDVHPETVVAQRKRDVGEREGVLGSMGMAAGDFLTSYASADNAEAYDSVVTVYFVDTAPNLIRYIETIRHCLRNGGIWINIGPLLWHFDGNGTGDAEESEGDTNKGMPATKKEDAGIAEPGSFELTNDEVIALVSQLGFDLIYHEQLSDDVGGYIQDPRSMIQNRYRCSHWVARKTATVESRSDL